MESRTWELIQIQCSNCGDVRMENNPHGIAIADWLIDLTRHGWVLTPWTFKADDFDSGDAEFHFEGTCPICNAPKQPRPSMFVSMFDRLLGAKR
jgi:hypothetical protein